MTALYAALAVIIVVLLGIATYYLVEALRQIRRTARAAEEFLLSARPRVEETSQNLNGLLRRADGMMSSMEEGIAVLTPPRDGALGTVMRALSTASAVVAGATQVARLFFNDRHASQAGTQSEEETGHGKQPR